MLALSIQCSSPEQSSYFRWNMRVDNVRQSICLTPPCLSSLVSQPLFFNFTQRCPVAEEFDGESHLSISLMPLSTWICICSPDHFFIPLHLGRSLPGGVRWVLKGVPMLWPFLHLFSTKMRCWTAPFGATLCLRGWQLPRKVQHQLALDKTSGIIPAGATPAVSVLALGLPVHKTN